MYKIDPQTLDEMAFPSLFHANPLVRWITSTRLKKALSLIKLQGDLNLLDFGCGPAILLLQIPSDKGNLFGVDIELWPAERMVNHFKRNDIQLLHSKNWVDIVPDQILDYIVATEVLEHIGDVLPVLSNFRKKLKPGGKLIVSLPTENFIYQLGRKIAGFSGDYHQEEIVEIEKVCQSEGFSLEKKISIPAPGFFCLYKLFLFRK
jgi:2-polyprenyl-3-methyl-5-hydroxy-6-metoxy-1,4-benzoquinol methylase